MAKEEIAIALEANVVAELDRALKSSGCVSRDEFIEAALREKLRIDSVECLTTACEGLDPAEEKAFAEEGMAESLVSWPEY